MTNLEKLQKIASFRVDKIYDIKFDNGDRKHYEYETIRDLFPEYFAEIETALKNYEELTSKPIILYYGRTHGHTQALIDMVFKNYKEVKITNLEDEKKLKALKIIKEKKVDVFGLICCIQLNEYTALETYNMKENCHNCFLTQEEFDLLKEVLL